MTSAATSFLVSPPQISLPKGGGAIRGIGEKFAANPVTGTGSLTVPLPISPGRGGLQPSLALQYDSGAGNGPFGIGWSLTLTSISRKTEKGLPRYLDSDDSDVFLLGGGDDLVPAVDATGERVREPTRLAGADHRVDVYLPRMEGAFARIERWTRIDDRSQVFWRVLDRNNITQWFGRTAASRIADPDDATRIFEWLPCEAHDDKGNLIIHEYLADEPGAQRYLKRVRYGTRSPWLPRLHPDEPAETPPTDFLFELVFDFGDHDASDPRPHPDRPWLPRSDAFSNYRAGFERRTSRCVQRVLMFHHFPEAPETGADCLVRSLRLRYDTVGDAHDPAASGYTTLTAVESFGHERRSDGALSSRQLPPLEFSYSRALPADTVRSIAAADLPGLPSGTQAPNYHWIDLDGEGISGVLAEEGGAWRFSAPRGNARFETGRDLATVPARRALAGTQRLIDIDGDGGVEAVDLDAALPGFSARSADEWTGFVPFDLLPRIDWRDPNLRFLDLTGDGRADAFITEDEVFTWHESLGRRGFGPRASARPPEETPGTRLVFADGTQSLFLADMSGDGLTDLVRIRNGEVCYWPNKGYGRFGRKIIVGNAPLFDAADTFDTQRIRLVDIDGSGPADILYLGRDGAQLYFNRCGNRLSDARVVPFPVATSNLAYVQVVDLLGTGTACLVWNSHLPADRETPVRYVDLMGGIKPHLLVGFRNNLGVSTQIDYRPSTHYYLADKAAGRPWLTRLPFPVQCVDRVTTRNRWRGTAFTHTYSYHHGYYDAGEREFRGFGRIEQTDVEDYGEFATANSGSPWITADLRLFQPPVRSIRWHHTGASSAIDAAIAREYFVPRAGVFRELAPFVPSLPDDLTPAECAEALRALKGVPMREEIYELEPQGERAIRLLSATSSQFAVRRVQPRGPRRHGVFLCIQTEQIVYHYELALDGVLPADPRIAHSLVLSHDELGHPQQTVAIAYPRTGSFDALPLAAAQLARIQAVQSESHLRYSEARYTNDVRQRAAPHRGALRHHRLRLLCETAAFELAGIARADRLYFTRADFAALGFGRLYPPLSAVPAEIAVASLPFESACDGSEPQSRLIDCMRTQFFDDAADGAPVTPLPFGEIGPRALKAEDFRLALTRGLLDAVFRAPEALAHRGTHLLDWTIRDGITPRTLLDDPARAGYLRGDAIRALLGADSPTADAAGEYWLRSGIPAFGGAAAGFYLPDRIVDAFGGVSRVEYDDVVLHPRAVVDACDNRSEVLRFDYRRLLGVEVRDANGNHREVCVDCFGQVVATATKGKRTDRGWEGDDLDDFATSDDMRNPDPAAVADFLGTETCDEDRARDWLARASARFLGSFGEAHEDGRVRWETQPPAVCTLARERHATDPRAADGGLQITVESSDGGDQSLATKQRAEPAFPGGPPRWLVKGMTVFNNKGRPVKQFEPWFSAIFRPEAARAHGVAPILYYDALGRVVRSDLPDGTYTRSEFSPWHQSEFDATDTVLDSAWHAARQQPGALPEDRRAAAISALHANTPGHKVFDSLAREVITIVHNRRPNDAALLEPGLLLDAGWIDEYTLSHTRVDAEGKPLWVEDARGNRVVQHVYPPSDAGVPAYDLAGNLLHEHGMDTGARWLLADAAGKPLLTWDANGTPLETRVAWVECDELRRPRLQWLRRDGHTTAVERWEYRDSSDADAAVARATNLIGKLVLHEDPAARTETLLAGFDGKPRRQRRTLARRNPGVTPDWSGLRDARDALLEAEAFMRLEDFDALGRPSRIVNWHRTPARVFALTPAYNARGLLESEEMRVGARLADDGTVSGGAQSMVVSGIEYDARGQRLVVRRGNGTVTRYDFEPETFRLRQLRTTRPGATPPFPGHRSQLADERVLQQLFFTRSAGGNVVGIEDEAFAPVFFRNQAVGARSHYLQDAAQHLIEATGREGALRSAPPDSGSPPPPSDLPSAEALRQFTQRYLYDETGNLRTLRHFADGANWTRHFETASDSNRLARTWIGDESDAVTIHYDAQGCALNLTRAAPGARLRWDWRNMLERVDLEGGGEAFYEYDIANQRTRKSIERIGGARVERAYLGGYERFQRLSPGGGVLEEIESHHVFLDDERVLLVEDVLATDDVALGAGTKLRYQYGNLVGSVALELDAEARVISHEEFHPYGTSAWQLTNRAVRSTAKRYRYTGMERDEESGLSYHGARYYVPWLARWCAADPAGIRDGLNRYQYARARPVECRDPDGKQTVAEAMRLARMLHAIDPDAFGVEYTIYEGRYIPTPRSLADHRLFTPLAERARANVLARGSYAADGEALYNAYRTELNSLIRAEIAESGPIASLIEIVPSGDVTRLRFRSGIFRGQFLEFAHDVSRAEVRRFGAAPALTIELENLAAVGFNFHRTFLHIEQAITDFGRLTPEAVRDLVRAYAAESSAATSAERAAARELTSGAAASSALPRGARSLLADTGGSASIFGVFGGLAAVALLMLTMNQLRDAESTAERGEILFDVLAPILVQMAFGATAGLGFGVFLAVLAHAETGSHWCEDYSGGCAVMGRYLADSPEATEEDLDMLHALLEMRARDARSSRAR